MESPTEVATPLPPSYDADAFATLTPFDLQAEAAFDLMVKHSFNELPAHFEDLVHWFEAGSAPSASGSSFSGEDENQHEASSTSAMGKRDVQHFRGHFRFDLAKQADHPQWVFGTDRDIDVNAAKFPACPHSQRSAFKISPRHARFYFNRFAVLMVVATSRRGVTVVKPGGSIQKLELSEECALVNQLTTLKLGNCTYTFSWQPSAKTGQHREALERYLHKHHVNFEPLQSMASTGNHSEHDFHGYGLLEPFARGTDGMVSTAIAQADGIPVVMKRIQRHSRSAPGNNELDILRSIRDLVLDPTPRIIKLRDTFQESNDFELIMVLEPRLAITLDQVVFDVKFSDASRLTMFKHLLEAVSWLHEHHFIHRDIKLQNAGLASFNPVSTILFDFGHATTASSSNNHLAGTIVYLAPEVLKLKAGLSTERYDCGVDVWATGLTCAQVLCRTRWSNRDVVVVEGGKHYDLPGLDRLMSMVRQQPFADILEAMLQQDPEARSTARHSRDKLQNYLDRQGITTGSAAPTLKRTLSSDAADQDQRRVISKAP